MFGRALRAGFRAAKLSRRITMRSSLPLTAEPAWRTAMTATDTLYYVGTSTPESAPALPSPHPTQFGQANGPPGDGFVGAGWDVMGGYSCGTRLDTVGGNYGTMVYGCGGHNRVQNQLLGFNLNQDDPTFSWWQLPTYKTTETGGAQMYYSPSEQSALLAGGRGSAAVMTNSTGAGEDSASVTGWDRAFPVAYNGWIFPRKITTGQMGDNAPHGFRYKTTAFIPASVTGGAPLFMMSVSTQGPFTSGYVPQPGVSLTDWVDASAITSGVRRWPYYFRNCVTGAWTEHQWQPAGALRGSGFSSTPIGVFPDNKRVYVMGGVTGSSYWYLDFSAGYAGHTLVVPNVNVSQSVAPYSSLCFSVGDLLGRHFAVGLAQTSNPEGKLTVIDFDAGTSYYIDLAAQGFAGDPQDEFANITYDAANARVLYLQRNSGTNRIEYWSITVPATLNNSAGWVCSAKRTPALADAGMSSTHFGGSDRLANMYGKSDYLPDLGVCLVPFYRHRMLAFRPSV
jgi:hypothetical protein